MKRFRPAVALAASLVLVAGCGGGGGDNAAGNGGGASNASDQTQAAGAQTLAALLAQDVGSGRIAAIARNAGLEAVLSGVGPYTVLVPSDAAVERLGAERADGLQGENMRAAAAALLRAHIVPGALTRADLEAAITRASGGRAEMRNMAGGTIAFFREGDGIVAEGAGGARARLTDGERRASNGAMLMVDGLLVPAG